MKPKIKRVIFEIESLGGTARIISYTYKDDIKVFLEAYYGEDLDNLLYILDNISKYKKELRSLISKLEGEEK